MIGAVVCTVGLAILGVGVIKSHDAYDKIPNDEYVFEAGKSTTVPFDAGETRVVFVDNRDDRQAKCTVTNARGADVAVKRVTHPQRLHLWRSVFSVTATDAGDYSVSCTGGRFDRFGVGGDVTEGSTPTLVLTAVGYLLALTGLVGAIYVARRRYRGRP